VVAVASPKPPLEVPRHALLVRARENNVAVHVDHDLLDRRLTGRDTAAHARSPGAGL
jgi:hypothetical protein